MTPDELLRGTVLVVAPHMDDEVLGCGGVLAGRTQKDRVHVAYVADGAGSAGLHDPRHRADLAALREVRREESRRAMACIGVPCANLAFWEVPDGQVAARADEVAGRLREAIASLRPETVLAPFRYDRHPDHVAVSRLARAAAQQAGIAQGLLEYFVYPRWRLLPGGDVRRHVRERYLAVVDTRAVAEAKRRALACFATQCTRYFAWQRRPVLSPSLVAQCVSEPERFLHGAASASDRELFDLSPLWIRLAHAVEPAAKRIRARSRERFTPRARPEAP